MTKRKIVVILTLLILSVPIVGFAQVNNSGVPFKELQNQIVSMKEQISTLQQQIEAIQQNQVAAGVTSRNTIAAHGVVGPDGENYFFSEQFFSEKDELNSAVFYNILLPSMSDQTKRPTCVVSPGNHSVQANYNLGMYQGYPEFNTQEGAWTFVVVSQRNGLMPYKSAFSFICVQE